RAVRDHRKAHRSRAPSARRLASIPSCRFPAFALNAAEKLRSKPHEPVEALNVLETSGFFFVDPRAIGEADAALLHDLVFSRFRMRLPHGSHPRGLVPRPAPMSQGCTPAVPSISHSRRP